MFQLVQFLVWALGVYALIGAFATIWLQVRGLARMDDGTRGAGVLFRILITPGMIALWPLLVRRYRESLRGESPPHPARPLSPVRLRRAHGSIVRAIALLLPIAVGAAILLRPPAWLPSDAAEALADPPPLGERIGSAGGVIENLPLLVHLRRAGDVFQIETELDRDAGIPSLMLYWNPAGANAPLRDSVFLGRIWGPGIRRFALPAGADPARGGLVFHSLARRERLGAVDLSRLAGGGR